MHLNSHGFIVSSSSLQPSFSLSSYCIFYDVHQHENIVVNVRTSTGIVKGGLKYLLCQYYWLKLKLQLRNVAH